MLRLVYRGYVKLDLCSPKPFLEPLREVEPRNSLHSEFGPERRTAPSVLRMGRCKSSTVVHSAAAEKGTETAVPISDLRDLVQRCVQAEGHDEASVDIITDVSNDASPK